MMIERKGERRRLFTPLMIELRDMPSDVALEWLWSRGMIDIAALESRAIRLAVEHRYRSGERKTRAMDEVAHQFRCSYEKVRKIVYSRV